MLQLHDGQKQSAKNIHFIWGAKKQYQRNLVPMDSYTMKVKPGFDYIPSLFKRLCIPLCTQAQRRLYAFTLALV